MAPLDDELVGYVCQACGVSAFVKVGPRMMVEDVAAWFARLNIGMKLSLDHHRRSPRCKGAKPVVVVPGEIPRAAVH